MNTISIELINAYFSAQFIVYSDDTKIILKPDNKSEELINLHSKHHVTTSCLITAYNPYSRNTDKHTNEKAQLELINTVSSKWRYLNATGLDPNEKWEEEPSILVLGISLNDSISIGQHFGQNAVLFAPSDGCTRLYNCNNGLLLTV